MLAPAIVPDWPQLSIKKATVFITQAGVAGINHHIFGFRVVVYCW